LAGLVGGAELFQDQLAGAPAKLVGEGGLGQAAAQGDRAVGGLDAWLALGDGARAARLLLWILVGGGVYTGVLLLTGVRPADFMEPQ